MKILILGGDGYLGWPTAMNLSAAGHEVVVVDNYLRRNIAQEESVEPLYALPNLIERCKIWKVTSGHNVVPHIGDLQDWAFVEGVFNSFTPDAIVHYAEQPSAPYSMKDHNTARLTLTNNLLTTFNVLQAMHLFCPDAHLVKLGTMGEYGTPNIDIEEGWLNVTHKDRSDRFLFPRQAGSLYHTTKIQDTDMIWLYVRMWGLRVTDLMQGPVYGVYTDENKDDDRLLPHFAYDEMFGTVLNRFIVQVDGDKPVAGIFQCIRCLGLADADHRQSLFADATGQTGKVTVGRDQNKYAEMSSVQHIHRVDDQSDIGRILALGIGSLLVLNQSQFLRCLCPASQKFAGPVAIDAAQSRFAEFCNFLQDGISEFCRNIVGVDKDRQAFGLRVSLHV